MFTATFFDRQGRACGMATGVEDDIRCTAGNNGWQVVEGDYRDYFLPGGGDPVRLADLTVPLLSVDKVIDFGLRRQGDWVVLDGKPHFLEHDEPVAIQFDTPGEFQVVCKFLGYRPCRFTVAVP